MKVIRDLLLTGLGLILLLVCIEGGMRLLGVRFSTVDTQVDPVLGYALIPNKTGWETTEAFNSYRINSDGMRDVEHSLERPSDTLRVAFLGDSITEAVQVPLKDTYVSVFQRKLQKCVGGNGLKIEALNFGVLGYNVAQDYYELDDKVWKYHPQIVVAALAMGTAITADSRKLDPLLTPPRMYFTYKEGQLVSDAPAGGFRENPWKARLSRISDEFELTKMLRSAKSRMAFSLHDGGQLLPQVFGHVEAKNVAADAARSEDVMFAPPATPDLKRAWTATEGILELMDKACRAHGAVFHVVTLDIPSQTTPGADVRKALAKKLGVSNLDYSDDRIGAFCKQHGIPCFHLAPALRAVADRKHIYLHEPVGGIPDQGHWNEAGHHSAGTELAKDYCNYLHGAGRNLANLEPRQQALQAEAKQ